MKPHVRWLTNPYTIALAVSVSIAVVLLTSGGLLQEKATSALHEALRRDLVHCARAAALQVDGDQHSRWKPGDETSPEYQQAILPFRRLMQAMPEIDDIYTCILKDGKVRFVLDAAQPGDNDGDGVEDKAYIGEVYEEATPEMLLALRQGIAIAENRLYTDRWGSYISGYAPIRNSHGEVVGIVGVDLHAKHYLQWVGSLQRFAQFVYTWILLLAVVIAVVVWQTARQSASAYKQLRLHARAMEMAANAIVITDRKGAIQWVNPAFTSMTGYGREEVLGQNPRILKSGKQDRAFYQQMWQTILSGQVWKGELVNRRKDGSLYTEEMTIAPVWDETAHITHFIAIKQDVTERKQVEHRLSEALQQAQAANRAKSEFLANMSHEIRTPMNGILGMAQLLLDTPLNEEQRDYVNTLKNSAESLLSLLGDILDISKIEAGKMRLVYAPLDLREVVNQVVHLFGSHAKEKGLSLQVYIADDIPARLIGDELRLRQILSNLVGNAVKFTERGGVTIHATIANVATEQSDTFVRQQYAIPDSYHTLWLRIAVADTGIGIPADKRSAIFESFTQVDGSATRRYGGTGLGLAISRKLVELMGGTIDVESEEGEGSTFWIILPFFTSNMEQSVGTDDDPSRMHQNIDVRSAPTVGRAAKRALLVEDNEVNRKVATRLLQKLGCEVDIATDGVEAVEKTASQLYDVVLMDIHMPRMDGLDATRYIRERERKTGTHQVIIAMTASALKEDVERCLSSGMDDYLSKPVRLEVLREMLEKWSQALEDSGEVNRQPIDTDFLAEMTGGDEEFGKEVLQEFLETTPRLIQEVDNAVQSGDSGSLVRAAHTLKGSARAVGAQALADIAFALERLGKEHNLLTASDNLHALHQEWQRVELFIKEHFLRRAA